LQILDCGFLFFVDDDDLIILKKGVLDFILTEFDGLKFLKRKKEDL